MHVKYNTFVTSVRCVCVCACVCVSCLSRTLSDFSFILLGGYQQPVYAGVCGVVCVCRKKEKKWKMKNRDSLARKSHFKTAVWWIPG